MVATILPLITLAISALSASAANTHGIRSLPAHARRAMHVALPARDLPVARQRSDNLPVDIAARQPQPEPITGPARTPSRRRKRSTCVPRNQGDKNGSKHSSTRAIPSATASEAPPAPSEDPEVGPPTDGSRVFKLVEKSQGKDFFDAFTFWDHRDPTNGNVDYVSREEAFNSGLAYVGDDGIAVMQVDNKNWVGENGQRKSVRIHSKNQYAKGLWIADIIEMPHGPSVWPAYWMNGDNWPIGGEVDILEGVHDQRTNHMTLHTRAGCTLDTSKSNSDKKLKWGTSPVGAFTGKALRTNCDARVDGNSGCGIGDDDERSYGAKFNQAGGGVFATLIDDDGIYVWFFSRDDVPADMASNPNPASWGTPKAFWSSSTCKTGDFFTPQTLIFNITLCGDWAGATFGSQGKGGSCGAFIANPGNFPTAKWRVKYSAFYQ